MNKNSAIIIVIILLVLIAGGIYFSMTSKSEETIMMEDKIEGEMMIDEGGDSMMEESEGGEMMEKTTDAMMKSGTYETYSPEKLALASEGDVILFFRASWCPTCRALDADIRANALAIPSGVVILDVDYDNSTALKQKYGVTYQHTLVQVDAEGNQIAKWTGSPTLVSLLTNIK